MNRKERRVAAKSGTNNPAGSGIGAQLSLAETQFRNGRLREADALYARLLAAEPRHALALHMRGMIALGEGRPLDAMAHFKAALAVSPAVAAIHHGLAETYRGIGQPADAERHYRRAAELQPGAVTLLNLGNALAELNRPADAATVYESALRFDARLPEAFYGLGTALATLGRPEAGDAFARAAALRPDFALAHEGLIDACLAADAVGPALQAACGALLRVDTPRLRVQFVDCLLRGVVPTVDVPGLRDAVQRALAERWTRPQDLARAACAVVALRQPLDDLDPLLRTLLELAPVCDRDVEQALTARRRTLLQADLSGTATTPHARAAACALARQCFINEYAWRCEPDEWDRVDGLRHATEADLDRGLVPPDAAIMAIAMYLPLASLRGAEALLRHPWAPDLSAVLAQQVGEPAEERRLRDSITRATSIDNDISRLVRDQYEENPYPRWVAAAGMMHRVRLGEWLAARFPDAPLAALPGDTVLDVLIAGCGTGQQALDTVRGFSDVDVLAIDLSLASLGYAARMTAALGAENVEYAQADLLESAQLGRSFDMIGVGGVLHHLADPWTGWRTLAGLLRPGGVMNVLLYTVRGRADVRIARDWIAAHGYRATVEDIRRCRQDLMALGEDWAVRLSASPDFNSVSGCRDLLFHVQESAVTLPDVARFLAAEGLDLLGVEVSAATEQAFKAWNRGTGNRGTGNRGIGDESLRDLARWDLFEAEHPGCFAGMLNLWVQKPPAPVS